MHGKTTLTDCQQAPQACRSCVVRQSGICSVLSEEEITRLNQIAHRQYYKPGQTILACNDKPNFLAVVGSGVVKLSKLLDDGRQQIVGLLFPPDFLGRVFLREIPYFAKAAGHVELCCFPHAEFERMVKNHQKMSQHLLEHSLNKLDMAHDWMVLLGRKNAEERVASLIYLLATRSKLAGCPDHEPNSDTCYELHLKREEMADFLGLTYETVIRHIRALDRREIICFKGRRKFFVPDLAALAKVAG